MGQAISGQGGRGTVTAYTAAKDYILAVQTVQFGLAVPGSGGPHWATVAFGDANLPVVFESVTTVSVPDSANSQWNFGVGMVEAKQDPTGGTVPVITAPLPEMDLFPGGMVIIQARQGNGAIDSNAIISNVIIYADLILDTSGSEFGIPPLVPGLLYG